MKTLPMLVQAPLGVMGSRRTRRTRRCRDAASPRKFVTSGLTAAVCALLLWCAPATRAQETSRVMPFYNIATSLPASTTQPLTVQLWDASVGGAMIFSEFRSRVVVDVEGQIHFMFGSRTSGGLDPSNFPAGSSRYIDVVDASGTSVLLEGRIPLTATAFSLSPGPPGPEGPAGPPGPVHSITAGAGLVGGGIGDVILSLAPGATVTTLNGLTDEVTLVAGNDVTITPSGNTLTIAAKTDHAKPVVHNATLSGEGTKASPVGLALPLQLSSPVPGAVLQASNTDGSSGAGVTGSGSTGVEGISLAANGIGVAGFSEGGRNARGIWGASPTGYAAVFDGKVHVAGMLAESGGAMKIDHPLTPGAKYLTHSNVQSADMKNIYDGVVVLDANGQAVVELPAWFEALNKDFRYQLTSIGAAAPNLHVAEKIAKNRFKIGGGLPGMEISWQVTGVRHDPWAEANRVLVEEQKPSDERGFYLHPHLYGAPEEKGIEWAHYPELIKRLREEIAKSLTEAPE